MEEQAHLPRSRRGPFARSAAPEVTSRGGRRLRDRGGECLDSRRSASQFFANLEKSGCRPCVDDTVRASEAVQILGRTAMHAGACREKAATAVRAAGPGTSCHAATMAELIGIDPDVGTAIARKRRDRCQGWRRTDGNGEAAL
jgi:hypothetical protein